MIKWHNINAVLKAVLKFNLLKADHKSGALSNTLFFSGFSKAAIPVISINDIPIQIGEDGAVRYTLYQKIKQQVKR